MLQENPTDWVRWELGQELGDERGSTGRLQKEERKTFRIQW